VEGAPRKVREDRAQLSAGPRGPDLVEPLAVLLGGESTLGIVLGQVGSGLLTVGVADPQVPFMHWVAHSVSPSASSP
jgi:hypothetical protein